jgi:diadenosine tetraphosphatase ApaH/serine/threonine PP2A family protein phosphatase
MLALLYDVHGNLPALEAVLDDAAAQGAERFLLGGDYALFGAWPVETVERLRALDAEWIRGNGERWCADPESTPDHARPAVDACRDLLGERVTSELGALQEMLGGDGVLFCHGSPVSDVESFWPEPAADEGDLVGDASERRLVFGHTHLPFARTGPRGIELVNPGSVGMPFDGDQRAAYALVHDDGRVEHRRVPYVPEWVAAELRRRFPDFGETLARRIELARFDVG